MPIKKIIKQNNVPKLQSILEQLKSKRIEIGIFNDNPYVLMYSTVNEFGMNINITPKMRAWLHANGLHVKDSTTAIHIPERSFIRKTANEKEDEMSILLETNLNLLLTFKIDINTFFNELGQKLVDITKQTVQDTYSPPNHPFSLSRKNGTHPLIDTGKLLESISYKII
jgi:hypothetical protein